MKKSITLKSKGGKRLQLSCDTLRQLQHVELSTVHGGPGSICDLEKSKVTHCE